MSASPFDPPRHADGRRRALVWMLACVALWAALDALTSDLWRPYSPYEIVWARYAVHLLLMLAIWGRREPQSLWHTKRPAFQLARSLLMVAMPAAFITGMARGMDARALLAVFWLSPLLILAIARFTLREKVPPSVWSVTLAACLGAALLTGVHTVPHLRQLVFPLGMGLSFGLYVVMTRSLQTESMRANLFYTALGVFLALTPAIPHLWVTPGLHDTAILVSVGILGFLVLLALDRAASLAPVSQSAAATCAQVAFVALLTWGFGRIVPSAWMLVGLALLGIALVTLWARNPKRAVPEVA